MPRTVVQRFVEDVRIVVRTVAAPARDEFDAHILEAVERASAIRAVLIVLLGDGAQADFGSEQRSKLSKAGLFSTATAVLAPVVHASRILDAKWIGAPIRVFPADAFDDACDFLDVPSRLRAAVRDAVESARPLIEQAP